MGLYLGQKLVSPSKIIDNSSDTIIGTNFTGSPINSGDKVWVEKTDIYTQNFNILGTPTINDRTKVLSNLSSLNYIRLLMPTIQNTTDFEFNTKFVFKAGTDCETELIYSNASCKSCYLYFRSSNGSYQLRLSISSNGTSYDIVSNALININLIAGVVYYIKLRFDGQKYELLYSTDNETWTIANTIISSNMFFTDNENYFFIGDTIQIASTVSIYLLDVNMKVNGNVIWSPYTKIDTINKIIPSKDVYLTSITGVAQEYIENNSNGIIKTILDGNGTYAPLLGNKAFTTNGTYSASSDNFYGYDTVTINVTGSGKYHIFDRVKDDNNNEIGTVAGFFTDANNIEYAVVFLDSQYCAYGLSFSSGSGTVTDLPVYTDIINSNIWQAKETATFNTQKILDWCASFTPVKTSGSCEHCRSKSFVIDGLTYYGQLPNFPELVMLAQNIDQIIALDITDFTKTGNNQTYSYSTSNPRISSNQQSQSGVWRLPNNANNMTVSKTTTNYIITSPVLEIPNQ